MFDNVGLPDGADDEFNHKLEATINNAEDDVSNFLNGMDLGQEKRSREEANAPAEAGGILPNPVVREFLSEERWAKKESK